MPLTIYHNQPIPVKKSLFDRDEQIILQTLLKLPLTKCGVGDCIETTFNPAELIVSCRHQFTVRRVDVIRWRVWRIE